jgi:hypothetical protein
MDVIESHTLRVMLSVTAPADRLSTHAPRFPGKKAEPPGWSKISVTAVPGYKLVRRKISVLSPSFLKTFTRLSAYFHQPPEIVKSNCGSQQHSNEMMDLQRVLQVRSAGNQDAIQFALTLRRGYKN